MGLTMRWSHPPRASKRLIAQATERLRPLLPSGWQVNVRRSSGGDRLRLVSPTGETTELAVWAQKDITPRGADELSDPPMPGVVVARWLSPRTREILRGRRIGAIDLTGNVELALDSPTVLIRTEGAQRDPNPKPTQAPTLRGPGAWALLRTVAEVEPPFGVRELAEATELDPGYVSRILRVLEEEMLISRTPRGPVTDVDWEGVLRRLITTYSLLGASASTTWVAAGGPDGFLDDISEVKRPQWAITGSFGAVRLAPVAAPALAVVFTRDPDPLVRAGRLLPADRGANVILVEPYEPMVFKRTWAADGSPYVSVAQLAVDCLTGPGRMPSEGDALLEWMRSNPKRWRGADLDAVTDPIAA